MELPLATGEEVMLASPILIVSPAFPTVSLLFAPGKAAAAGLAGSLAGADFAGSPAAADGAAEEPAGAAGAASFLPPLEIFVMIMMAIRIRGRMKRFFLNHGRAAFASVRLACGGGATALDNVFPYFFVGSSFHMLRDH